MITFRWETPTYQSAKSAAICDVERNGVRLRLYARRMQANSRAFLGGINGKLNKETYHSLAEAKAHLEKLATEVLGWKPDNG